MNSQIESDIFTYKCGKDAKEDSSGADPVTTELVRNALGISGKSDDEYRNPGIVFAHRLRGK